MQRLGGCSQHLRQSCAEPSSKLWQLQHRSFRRAPWPRKIEKIPMRETFSLFNLSPLVLDLDSEDNRHVRPYNEELDDGPSHTASKHRAKLDALRARIKAFEIENEKLQTTHRETVNECFSPWRVLDLDIVSMAIAGTPSHSKEIIGAGQSPLESQTSSMHANLLQKNGIPTKAWDDSIRTMSYLIHRRDYGPRDTGSEDRQAFQKQLQNCENVTELKRLLVRASRRPSKPKESNILVYFDHDIAKACEALEELSESTPVELLKLFNDLLILERSRRTESPPFGPRLCGIGLKLSAQCNALPAAKNYLALGLKWDLFRSLDSNDLVSIRKSLDELMHMARHIEPPGSPQQPGSLSAQQDVRPEIYTLLTGIDIVGSDLPSFRDAMEPFGFQSWAYEVYIRILGELKAYRTLWHEWHRCERSKEHDIISQTELFRSAIKDIDISNAQFPGILEQKVNVRSKYADDCLLDLEDILLEGLPDS